MDKSSSMTSIAEKYGGLEKIRQDIKRKFNAIRDGEWDAQFALKKVFKPITEPLTVLQKTVAAPKSTAITTALKIQKKVENKKEEEEQKEESPLEVQPQPSTSKLDVGTSFLDISSNKSQAGIDISSDEDEEDDDDNESFHDAMDENKEDNETDDENVIGSDVEGYLYNMDRYPGLSDTVYGVRKNANGEFLIGNRPVTFDSAGRLHVDDEVFEPTPGFLELLFKKKPTHYTDADREQFQRVVTLTNSHRSNNHPTGKPLSNRGRKYNEIIKPLFGTSTPSTRPAIAPPV